jgi:flagellar assembly protein FliH
MLRSSTAATTNAALTESQPLTYPLVHPVGLVSRAGADSGSGSKCEGGVELIWTNSQQSEAQGKYTEDDLKARIQAAEKQAREQGFLDADAKLRAKYETNLAIEHQTIAQAIEGFERERAIYFERVEGEVVQLALAIARKILHREAQIDPLFLTGVVRVAIEKIAADSAVKLRVPENEVFRWRQILAALKGVRTQPELVGDPSLANGCCIMQTEVGNTDISVHSQFQEIERGLLDLLALRPAS